MDLSQEGLQVWWTGQGDSVAKTVDAMDHRDYWAVDKSAAVRAAIQDFGQRVENVPLVRLLECPLEAWLILLGYTSSSIALRLLRWINDEVPQLGAEIIAEAEALSAGAVDPNTPPRQQTVSEASRIVLCRVVHLDQSAVLRRVFSADNLRVVLEASARARATLLARS